MAAVYVITLMRASFVQRMSNHSCHSEGNPEIWSSGSDNDGIVVSFLSWGVALDADGGEVKSCLSDWCYAQSCLFHRCYARLIFHGDVDNSSDKGIAELYPEGGLVV
jgi:hypothetical protein